MDRNRILELALEELEKQRKEVEASIAEIRELQGGRQRITTENPAESARVVVKRRSRTPAQRRAQAMRMKEYWAQKRGSAKVSTGVRKPAKTRTKTAAQKRALSLKMREVWKRRKAAAAKKTAGSRTAKAPEKA